MADPFIGEIIQFAGNFAPRGWALCDGQLLSISQYTALFSILGTTYGGDGRTSFGLPDLRGRVPMHPGDGPGLSSRSLGQKSGAETVSLTTNEIPAHSHTGSITAAGVPAVGSVPDGARLAHSRGADIYAPEGTETGGTINGVAVTNTGGGQSHTNIQPFQCVNFIIALEGTFPSRN